jgi:threonine/homoserine/homoserine lactone efflux protein
VAQSPRLTGTGTLVGANALPYDRPMAYTLGMLVGLALLAWIAFDLLVRQPNKKRREQDKP